MRDETVAQVAPSGTCGNSFNVNCNNPLLSASEVATWCTSQGLSGAEDTNLTILRRNLEGGPRQNDLTHTDFRDVLGLRGDIVDGWKYDAYALYSEVQYSEEFLNDVSLNHIQNALLVDPATGQCFASEASAINAYAGRGCAPYNLFGTGAPSAAAIGYISVPGFQRGFTKEQVASASITGDLGQYGVKLPTAKDGVSVAFGAEYQQELLSFQPDEEFVTGDLAGQGGAKSPVSGGYHVAEGFGEFLVPLVEDMFLAKGVIFHGSYRYSSYDLGYDTST